MRSSDGNLTTDLRRRDTRKQREAFIKVRNAEIAYGAKLRRVAAHVGDLIRDVGFETTEQVEMLMRLLERYSDLLRPWARAVSFKMLADVNRRDETAWRRYARFMGVELKRQLTDLPVGEVTRRLQDEQVELITSLPIEAAQRVQKLALESRITGARSSEIRDELLRSGEVARSRATLIARTETAKASSTLTQARATAIGSEAYVWRTVRDVAVRESHRKMEGKTIRWDTPPEVEPGKFYHVGQIFNCRCFAEPILPDRYGPSR